MNRAFVRRRGYALAVTSLIVFAAACEDKRTKELSSGITRDSAVTVLAQKINGGGRDSFPNVYSREQYLIAGKNYEVLYFTPDNKKFKRDSATWHELTPIVFVDNKLLAKGWDAWDSVSTANHIPLRDHKTK